MIRGQWVRYRDWNVWVEDSWLDSKTPTHFECAKEIAQSGWLKENDCFKKLVRDRKDYAKKG